MKRVRVLALGCAGDAQPGDVITVPDDQAAALAAANHVEVLADLPPDPGPAKPATPSKPASVSPHSSRRR
jgi:hypothetical protein